MVYTQIANLSLSDDLLQWQRLFHGQEKWQRHRIDVKTGAPAIRRRLHQKHHGNIQS